MYLIGRDSARSMSAMPLAAARKRTSLEVGVGPVGNTARLSIHSRSLVGIGCSGCDRRIFFETCLELTNHAGNRHDDPTVRCADISFLLRVCEQIEEIRNFELHRAPDILPALRF